MATYGKPGENPRRWDEGSINRAFDDLYQKLGRVPTLYEFVGDSPGAAREVQGGIALPGVHTWNEYLAFRNLASQKPKWNQESIDAAYNAVANELGRPPTAKELQERTPGALGAIQMGQYDPTIRTYREYLDKHRGKGPEKKDDGDDDGPDGPAGMLAPLKPKA